MIVTPFTSRAVKVTLKGTPLVCTAPNGEMTKDHTSSSCTVINRVPLVKLAALAVIVTPCVPS